MDKESKRRGKKIDNEDYEDSDSDSDSDSSFEITQKQIVVPSKRKGRPPRKDNISSKIKIQPEGELQVCSWQYLLS